MESRFRWWVVPLGAALIPLNSLWIARAEALDYSGFPTCMSLFYNVVFTLLVLMAANSAVLRAAPRAALNRPELLVVYAMLATGSSLVGHDYLQMLVPTIAHTAYFASPANRWDTLFASYLPAWLTIPALTDPVRAYELGNSTLYSWDNLRVWLAPFGAWSVFLLAVIGATLAMSIIVRKQWVEHERLAYPIIQIPLLMTEGGGSNSLLRSPLLWAGFSIAAGIDTLNGLQRFFPSLPEIPVKMLDLTPMLEPYPPWTAMGHTAVSFYPFAIGLSFFMPTALAFSSWFFFLFRKMQQVTAASLGYVDPDPWFPHLREQSYGAWIALFAASLVFSRGYLRGIVTAALRDARSGDGGVSYRWALIALGLCTVAMTAFLIAAGMTPWLGIAYVVLYLAFCGGAARVRAELGPPSHEMGWIGTSSMLVMALGTTAVGPRNLALFSLLYFQNRMHRGLLMPQQVESLKAASESGMRLRTMVIALAVAGVVGVASAFWALTHLAYGRTYAAAGHPGAPGSGFAQEHFSQLALWLQNPVQPNVGGAYALALGAAAALTLAKLATEFRGFPFHPAGYALGMSFGLDYIWMPVFISWACKVTILRTWGLKGYRAAIPFFAGLVLGEFAVGGLWSFARGVLGVQTYTFYI